MRLRAIITNLYDVRTCSECFIILTLLDPFNNSVGKVSLFLLLQMRKFGDGEETVRNWPLVTGWDRDGQGPHHYSL